MKPQDREVVIVAAVRTAVGDFGGSLKEFAPSRLAAMVLREATARAGVSGDDVHHVVFGHVIHTEPRDMYLARVAAIDGGLAHSVPALTLNRLCGSGMQAIVSAAQAVLLGEADVAVAGGAEVMSRAPYSSPGMRWGARMGDARMVDMMLGALHDPFHEVHMGVTAENVAKKWGISRDEQDALALESHRRASVATREGRFREQILAIESTTRKTTVRFDADEHVRHDATIDDLRKLRPAFAKEDGTVTAGNASGINDGAAALVLMERRTAEARGARPLARLVSWGHAGVDPAYMGIGPVPASRKALERAGLRPDQIDVVEANEAFAAQAIAVTRDLELDPARVNPNGSGISIGHPVGATGALISVKAIYELQRSGGRYALATMCIGGGQGIAAVFERV